MKGTYRSLLVLIAFMVASVFVLAQTENGQISGIVTDKSGAVVSGAKVTATNPETGFTREAVTSGSGAYVISGLRPANYDVKVEGQGFKAVTRKVAVNIQV